jgi:hypothetical protein
MRRKFWKLAESGDLNYDSSELVHLCISKSPKIRVLLGLMPIAERTWEAILGVVKIPEIRGKSIQK